MIDNKIESLSKNFQFLVRVFLDIVKTKYPNVAPFETYRSRARQAWLYANKAKVGVVAKPGQSMHEKGLAVDWIFLNSKGQPTWKGDYKFLHLIGGMCGMVPVKGESCHLQRDGRTATKIGLDNSARRKKSDPTTQKWLSKVNDLFRARGVNI